jgi:hypothetical protein
MIEFHDIPVLANQPITYELYSKPLKPAVEVHPGFVVTIGRN